MSKDGAGPNISFESPTRCSPLLKLMVHPCAERPNERVTPTHPLRTGHCVCPEQRIILNSIAFWTIRVPDQVNSPLVERPCLCCTDDVPHECRSYCLHPDVRVTALEWSLHACSHPPQACRWSCYCRSWYLLGRFSFRCAKG